MIATQGRDILKFTMRQATLSSLLKEDINVAEELGTKDVIEQVDTRLGTLEQDVRSLDSKVDARFERVDEEFSSLRSTIETRFERVDQMFEELRSKMDARFERVDQTFEELRSTMDARFERVHEEIGGLRSEMNSTTRWLVGIIFASWLTMMASMASIWLKLGN